MFLPKAFYDAGWLTSALFIFGSGVLNCIACCKLIDTGMKENIFSYPLIVEHILGKKARVVLEISIALTQFAFVISHFTFLI